MQKLPTYQKLHVTLPLRRNGPAPPYWDAKCDFGAGVGAPKWRTSKRSSSFTSLYTNLWYLEIQSCSSTLKHRNWSPNQPVGSNLDILVKLSWYWSTRTCYFGGLGVNCDNSSLKLSTYLYGCVRCFWQNKQKFVLWYRAPFTNVSLLDSLMQKRIFSRHYKHISRCHGHEMILLHQTRNSITHSTTLLSIFLVLDEKFFGILDAQFQNWRSVKLLSGLATHVPPKGRECSGWIELELISNFQNIVSSETFS